MTGARRFSQAIAEGDGISVIARVSDAAAARRAEEEGAEGLAVAAVDAAIREATTLPILLDANADPGPAQSAGADAALLVVERIGEDGDRLEAVQRHVADLGLETVVVVRDDEELELALERLDPEIFLLDAPEAEGREEALDHVLELLPDVPAGKLAIAALHAATRDDVVALERAGIDAVLVGSGNVAELVGGVPPEV